MEVSGEEQIQSFFFDVTDSTHAGATRRAAVRCAEQLGMSESDRGAVAIAVTEMASNVIKHADHGKVLLDPIALSGKRGLRVLAIDKGRGIQDISAALADGHSTAGTGGNGLGAIRRLSTSFDIYSRPEQGTCVMAEFWSQRQAPTYGNGIELGVVSVPFRGELVCGDGWATKTIPGRLLLMLVDGLGHGIQASEAAREAERVLGETTSKSPATILQDAHDALRKTRGAAVAVAAIDCEGGSLYFSGLGNISATLIDPQKNRGIASHNGIAGHEMRKIQEFAFPWKRNSLLVMHSDGLSGRWDLADYPGLWNKPASLIAAVLYRDFTRERDDATVLVAKCV